VFGFGGLSMLAGLVVLALMAYVIYYAFTGSSRDRRSSSYRSQRTLEMLKERYARGEISHEKFLKMKDELER
jgi:putative membrane protein